MNRPIRMLALSPVWAHGGTEVFHRTLKQYLDPEIIDFDGVLVFNQLYDFPNLNADHPLDVDYAAQDDLDDLTADADILMIWGCAYDPILTRRAGRKVVFVCHGTSHWQQSILIRSSHVTDHVVLVSHHASSHILNHLPHSIIYNGIDTARLAQTRTRHSNRARLGFTTDDFIIGCVARLSEEKNQGVLIEALSSLPNYYKLLLCGQGPDQDRLADLAMKHRIGRVVFTTATDFLGDVYSAMDCHTLISEHEGFGLSQIEAMWCEIPTIATRTGIADQIIVDYKNGLIVDPEPQDVAAAISYYAALGSEAQQLAKEAKASIDNNLLALQMAEIYTKLFLDLTQT